MASRPKVADPRPAPRLYLMTPRLADATAFAVPLTAALDAADVAAVLLRLAAADEGTLIKRAKALGPLVQEQGAALLLDGHADLTARACADGTHLTGLADLAETIERLKPERIVGIGGLHTHHEAMLAAEQGADYVMFGEPDAHGHRPAFAAVKERITWWAELFEVPCVGYAASIPELASLAESGADFITLGDWLWRYDAAEIAETLTEAAHHLRLVEPAA